MNIIFKRQRLENKQVFAVSDLSHNYGDTTTQGKCVFYFISTFSILTYI